jgi:hypothetical protein
MPANLGKALYPKGAELPFHALLGRISHTEAPPSVAWDGIEHHVNHDQRYARDVYRVQDLLADRHPKRSRLLSSARQELDNDPGVEAAMAGARQDGELRVRETFAQGEGVLYGDLLVAIADHD